MAKKLFSKDLYAILGVQEEATEKEIIKGYRKKALVCHPDKNPDNPKAAELFHELSEALKVLTDAAARAAYDQSQKAKKAVQERNKVLDSKRKKFKEDLEAREQAFFEQAEKQREISNEQKLAAEIARLRRDGSRQVTSVYFINDACLSGQFKYSGTSQLRHHLGLKEYISLNRDVVSRFSRWWTNQRVTTFVEL